MPQSNRTEISKKSNAWCFKKHGGTVLLITKMECLLVPSDAEYRGERFTCLSEKETEIECRARLPSYISGDSGILRVKSPVYSNSLIIRKN